MASRTTMAERHLSRHHGRETPWQRASSPTRVPKPAYYPGRQCERWIRYNTFAEAPHSAHPLSPPTYLLSTTYYLLSTIYYYNLTRDSTLRPRPRRRDSDIWAIYSRLCLDHTLNYAQAAATVDDVDIESLNPGYAQPAYR